MKTSKRVWYAVENGYQRWKIYTICTKWGLKIQTAVLHNCISEVEAQRLD